MPDQFTNIFKVKKTFHFKNLKYASQLFQIKIKDIERLKAFIYIVMKFLGNHKDFDYNNLVENTNNFAIFLKF